jgi:hypothetical protein
MDFRYHALTSGESIVTEASTAWAYGSDYRYTLAADALEITLEETVVAGTLTVRDVATGVYFTSDTTAAAGKYSVASSKYTFAAADAGKTVEFMFQYTTGNTTKKIQAKVDSMPTTVKIVHTQKAFDQDNKLIGFEQTEYFKLQASSEFQKAYQERTAYAPTLSFKLVDPRRADKLYRQTLFIPYTAQSGT